MEHILLQDNDPEILDILTIALRLEGYSVFSTKDCQDVLSHIDKFRPHVVMLDFKLSGKQCIETYKLIRERYPHLPVIALSCNSNFHQDYSKYGFDDYIPKPFDLDHLYSLLRKYIPEQVG
jgi:DNA-binding response OmpR family regulator